jgi:hypothetical protein
MCPHYHWRTYAQRWTKENDGTGPLAKGSMFHLVLETWYRSLLRVPGNKAVAMSSVDQVFADLAATGKDPDTIDLVRWMFEGYVEHYGVDEEWKILAVEYRFEVPLRTASGRLSGFTLKGGVDLVAEHRMTGRRWVWDHKCLSDDTPIQTFSGKTRIGDVTAGDLVLSSDGTWTEVVAASRSIQLDCYLVTLRNGIEVVCSGDHVWPVDRSVHTGRYVREEITTAEMAANVASGVTYRMLQSPRSDRPERTFQLDPYLLGALLGDGGFTSLPVTFTKNHPGTVARVKAALPEGSYVSGVYKHPTKADTYRLAGTLGDVVKSLGLHGSDGPHKFIPSGYLLGSFNQRLELLRGLMDTDGSHRKGVPLYQTGSKQLANDVIKLVESLGGVATVWCNKGPKYQGGVGAPNWEVKMRFPSDFPAPYHHEEKLSRWKRSKASLQERLSVVSVEPIGERACTDLEVRAADSLFAVNGVMTHNSAANLPGDTQDLDFHDQFGVYKGALNLLDKNIFACLYNGVRTTRNKGDHPDVVAQWHADKAAGLKPGAQPKPQPIDGRFARVPTNRTDQEVRTLLQETLETARYLHSKANKHTRHPDAERCKRMCSMREACLTGRKLGDDREERFLLDTGWEIDHTRH